MVFLTSGRGSVLTGKKKSARFITTEPAFDADLEIWGRDVSQKLTDLC